MKHEVVGGAGMLCCGFSVALCLIALLLPVVIVLGLLFGVLGIVGIFYGLHGEWKQPGGWNA